MIRPSFFEGRGTRVMASNCSQTMRGSSEVISDIANMFFAKIKKFPNFDKSNDTIMEFRIGHGYDVHALSDGLRLVLGGVEIPHTQGFVAHSDGDVAIHAVCDALLGAAALGDIGLHFPDTSDDYAGIDSKLLLGRVAAMLRERGYEIGNVDCTIRMQRPKLRPYIDAMRAAMAGAMGIDTDRVSVKATTTERLGFEGREEGVSVSAVALIFKP